MQLLTIAVLIVHSKVIVTRTETSINLVVSKLAIRSIVNLDDLSPLGVCNEPRCVYRREDKVD